MSETSSPVSSTTLTPTTPGPPSVVITTNMNSAPPVSGLLLSGHSQNVSFSRVRSIDELDKRTLQLQNKKLWESLSEKREAISELRDRITQLEGRQVKDDEMLCIINRYWNQLDEDSLILLNRFETDIEEELFIETTSFLKDLASWESEEVPEKLQERVYFSKRILGKLLSAYDKLYMRQDRLTNILKVLKADQTNSLMNPNDSLRSSLEATTGETNRSAANKEMIQDSLRDFNTDINAENIRLHKMITTLQERHHKSNLKIKELEDSLSLTKDSNAELMGKLEESEYKCNQMSTNQRRTERRLRECEEENRTINEELSQVKCSTTTTTPTSNTEADNKRPGSNNNSSLVQPNKTKYAEMAAELEELRELASNRLTELEKIQRKHEDKVAECSRLALQLKDIPDNVIIDSIPYKSLKNQFNILYNELSSIRDQYEEYRSSTLSIRSTHIKQIQEMSVNEAAIQNQMKAELINQEEQYSQLKKEFEILEMDFKEAIEHNEQAAPISGEMRSLIATLQMQNKQLRSDVTRLKTKQAETMNELNVARSDTKLARDQLDRIRHALAESTRALAKYPKFSDIIVVENPQTAEAKVKRSDEETSTNDNNDGSNEKPMANDYVLPEAVIKIIQEQLTPMSLLRAMINDLIEFAKPFATMKPPVMVDENGETSKTSSTTDDACASATTSENDDAWAKFLLEATQLRHSIGLLMAKQKCLNKEACPSKTNSDENVSDLVNICEYGRDWAVLQLNLELAGAGKKLKQLTVDWNLCQELLISARQQEEVLMNEMEVTGQAFEDVQEQNARLLKSIREKDEANLKQMSDWMKTAQICRLLKEDKRLYDDQVRLMKTKIEALNRTIQKQEDKEHLLCTNLATLQRELTLRQQSQELLKRKSNDSQQAAEDLKVTVQKYLGQLKETQLAVQEKTSGYERANFRQQRIQEELTAIRRKYERLKKIEQSHNADEVLLAELHEYKEQLTCPTCKTNKKDAILTKCFHVFCLNCVKIRYDTRNRKCPKCNATFGANDFHRIYLT